MEIIAHRGASHDAPENTVAAARLAWAQGADAIEFDLHLTRDGKLVVIHDAGTGRVGGEARVVARTTMADLALLDVGRWKNPRYAGEKIPSLEDMLATVPAGKRVFVEIKGGPEMVGELARGLAQSHLRAEQIAIIAFDLEIASGAKRAMPACEVCWIVEHAFAPAGSLSLGEIIRLAQAHVLDGLDLEATWPIDAEQVRQVRAAGLKLYFWTVDDLHLAQHLREAGVDGLTTNRPGWLRGALGLVG